MDSNRLKSPAKFASLMSKVLSRVTPSETEEVAMRAGINTAIGRISKIISGRAEIVVAGSSARGTNLSGDSDVDIFMLFDNTVSKDQMEVEVINTAKHFVKGVKNESYVIKYAEHPYARLILGDLGLNIDLVPAYKISSTDEMGTSVDRTQLHNEFVKANMTSSQKGDVRVLKAFLKAHSIYGAESKTEGFSGYLCELLVIHYGSLLGVLEGIASAKMPLVIQPGRDAKESADVLVKRFGKDFVVVDPVDIGRNVAANVSEESLARFSLASRFLLDNPSESTFYSKANSDVNPQRKIAEIRNRLGISVHSITMDFKDISPEIIWQQAKRLERKVSVGLESDGMAPLISLCNISGRKAVICFFIENDARSISIANGPSVFMGNAADAFINAHSSAEFITFKNDRLFAVHRIRKRAVETMRKIASSAANRPSHMEKGRMSIHSDAKIPLESARLIYAAYSAKISV